MQNGIRSGQRFGISVRGDAWGNAVSDDYVCVGCGYFEQYFRPGRTLQKIAEKWPHAGRRDTPPPGTY